MFNVYILTSIVLMSLLFLRHISVYKDPNKINYTPVVLAIGFGSGVLHFAMMADGSAWLLTLRESLMSVIVGIILSTIMSVMSQTQRATNHFDQGRRLQGVVDEMEVLKNMFNTFNASLTRVAHMENSTHEQLKNIFKEEIEALSSILNNQKFFIQKVESVLAQQQLAQEKFEEFTLSELPSLDNVVHRHIDMLRISEQDHFNQLKNGIKTIHEEKKELTHFLEDIVLKLTAMQKLQSHEGITNSIEKELARVIHEGARQLQLVLSKAEGIGITLLENENLLKGSRDQSELIMQQMVLSSNQMKEITHHSKEIIEAFKPIGNLFVSAETLHKEFVIAKSKLSEIIVTLESYEKQEHRAMREHLENVAANAIAQMELFNETIVKHEQAHHVSPKEVQELSHKVKLHQSYHGE